MLHRLRHHAAREQGFTLIELLVVVLIIGILAAIAIPSFLNQETKGKDAVAKSSARHAETAMEACAVPAADGYSGCDVASLRAIEPTLSDAVLTVPAAAEKSYTVQVQASTGHTFSITRNDDGTVTRAATGGGTW